MRRSGRHSDVVVTLIEGKYRANYDAELGFNMGSSTRWIPDAVPIVSEPADIPSLRLYWSDRLAVPQGSIPLRSAAGATAVLPAVWVVSLLWRRHRSSRRRRAGRCPACGYDLRASPDRCPECGAEPCHARTTDRSPNGAEAS
jgi:hypothetical protein